MKANTKMLWSDSVISIELCPSGEYWNGKSLVNMPESAMILSPFGASEIPVSWAKYAAKKCKQGFLDVLKVI